MLIVCGMNYNYYNLDNVKWC